MILVKPSFEIIGLFTGMINNPLSLIERAGRICYKSEAKITVDSAQKFVKYILKNGHESVIEHSAITVKFVIDRGVSHELVRHRLVAYSQESTRYCNYKGGVTFVIPPWVNVQPGDYDFDCFADMPLCDQEWMAFMHLSEIKYKLLIQHGWTPQQARSVLPNSLKTEIMCTANFREWRHIFKLRCSSAAHPQMQEIMVPLRDKVRELVPIIFDEGD